jgi:hypothetical protein
MDSYDDTELALMKFGVGQPVPRMEDPTLLRGAAATPTTSTSRARPTP